MPGENERERAWNDLLNSIQHQRRTRALAAVNEQIVRELTTPVYAVRWDGHVVPISREDIIPVRTPEPVIIDRTRRPSFLDLKKRYGDETLLIFRHARESARNRWPGWDYLMFEEDAKWFYGLFRCQYRQLDPVEVYSLDYRNESGIRIFGMSAVAGFRAGDIGEVGHKVVKERKSAVIMDVSVFGRNAR
jgi:hypothetical protein